MKKILITGAYGFLGRHTARKYKEEGHHVTGIGHGKWYQDEFSKWGIDRWVESTITFESLINTNEMFDIIVHCGGSGSVGFSTLNPYEDFQKSVQSTLGLLEYIRLRAPKTKFIYPSSVAVQGSLPDIPIHEEMLSSPISPYGFHKKIAEELCKSYHINFGISTGVIRFFSVYGEGLKKQLLYDACKKIESAKTDSIIFFGTGKETRDWIHVKDASSLIYEFSLQLTGNEFINGGSGKRIEIAEVLKLVNKEFGSSLSIEFSGEAREGDPCYFWADITKAKQYNWRPTISLEQGIRSYVEYYKTLRND